MPACPSAPCFSPEATGSVPLLRDLLSDADVTRLHTLRPAPPVPGLYAGGTIANAELFYMRYAVSGASMCMGTVTCRVAAQEAMKYYGA